MSKLTSFFRILFKRKFVLLLLIFIFIILSVSIRFWYFNSEVQAAKKYKKATEILNEQIEQEKNRYLNDQYGAETPELTYQMFLKALEKKDINLAIKYFIYDKQDQYRDFFTEIQNNLQWDEMMEDLLNLENQKGELNNNDSYVIRVYNKENYLIAQAVLRKPTFLNKEEEINNIWKIIEF